MKRILIVGLNTLGASMAKALKRSKIDISIGALDENEIAIQKALSEEVIDYTSTQPAEVLAEADVVIIDFPEKMVLEFLNDFGDLIKDRAVVSTTFIDRESTIKKIVKHVPSHIDFIFIHPFERPEEEGYEASHAELFDGQTIAVSPRLSNTQESLDLMIELYQYMGAKRIMKAPPDILSKQRAHLSYLPHLLASAIVTSQAENPYIADLVGSPYKKISQSARMDKDTWAERLVENAPQTLEALDDFQEELDALKKALQDKNSGKLKDILGKSNDLYQKWFYGF